MRLIPFEICAAVFTAVCGTLLHFVYGWTGENKAAALISPVNESTWEHLKLLFFPALLSAVAGCLIVDAPGYMAAKFLGTATGLCSIVIIFYTYSGTLGRNFLLLDILTFYISVGIASELAVRWCSAALPDAWGWAGFAALAALFLLCTQRPPHIALFRCPVSGGYGTGKRGIANENTGLRPGDCENGLRGV